MKSTYDTFHGVLPINKPVGPSSHQAVDKVRRILGQQAIGHAGTLDPAAEGLLVLLLGRATKAARFLTATDKTYEALITLGRESTTYDVEGLTDDAAPAATVAIEEAAVRQILAGMVGRIRQTVPAYSAVRVNGQRLYERARRGEPADPPEREVEIHRLVLTSFVGNVLAVEVTCSAGTYVRSLAHDIGRKLGCGGYLSALRRTASGRLRLADAVDLDTIEAAAHSGTVDRLLLGIDQALGCEAITVADDFRRAVLDGRCPAAGDIIAATGRFASGDRILVKDLSGSVLAIAIAQLDSTRMQSGDNAAILKYDRVLA